MAIHKRPLIGNRNIPSIIGLGVFTCLLCGLLAYSRYIDFPSLDGSSEIRAYLPDTYPIRDAHHYSYHNFMDNWELYRFSTTLESIHFTVSELHLESQGMVHEFPLIISKPPPYWWDPELLKEAELFRSSQRAPDGHTYDLLYSSESGIAYMIRFDG